MLIMCVLSFSKHDSHLDLLSKEFHNRSCHLSSFEHPHVSFSSPFTFDVSKARKALKWDNFKCSRILHSSKVLLSGNT